MPKLDLTKKYKAAFTARTKPELVDIAPAQYLAIRGKGDPSGDDFLHHIQAMYSTAYTLKFRYKTLDQDFVVSKLEGQWWFDESRYKGLSISDSSVKVPRSEWEYRLLIRLPDYVSAAEIAKAKKTVLEKKDIALVENVALFEMHEGLCVQMLHVGPFDREPETLTVIGKFIQAEQLLRNGLHHEVYLSDFRKTAPEKLKTILREPVKR